jgi:hypothetical protein
MGRGVIWVITNGFPRLPEHRRQLNAATLLRFSAACYIPGWRVVCRLPLELYAFQISLSRKITLFGGGASEVLCPAAMGLPRRYGKADRCHYPDEEWNLYRFLWGAEKIAAAVVFRAGVACYRQGGFAR